MHNGQKYELYTETLSEGGLYLRKREPFPLWSEIEVILQLDEKHAMKLKGVVVHTKELSGDVLNLPPGMGIKFTEITNDQAEMLKSYIARLFAEDIVDSQEEPVIKI